MWQVDTKSTKETKLLKGVEEGRKRHEQAHWLIANDNTKEMQNGW